MPLRARCVGRAEERGGKRAADEKGKVDRSQGAAGQLPPGLRKKGKKRRRVQRRGGAPDAAARAQREAARNAERDEDAPAEDHEPRVRAAPLHNVRRAGGATRAARNVEGEALALVVVVRERAVALRDHVALLAAAGEGVVEGLGEGQHGAVARARDRRLHAAPALATACSAAAAGDDGARVARAARPCAWARTSVTKVSWRRRRPPPEATAPSRCPPVTPPRSREVRSLTVTVSPSAMTATAEVMSLMSSANASESQPPEPPRFSTARRAELAARAQGGEG